MRIPRIYEAATLQVGQTLALSEDGANHIGRVLRMQPGQQRQAGGGAIELGNSGQRHLHVRELRLRAEGEQATTLGPCYALPGGLCRWAVPADWRHKAVHIEADSDAGTLRSQVEASASQ